PPIPALPRRSFAMRLRCATATGGLTHVARLIVRRWLPLLGSRERQNRRHSIRPPVSCMGSMAIEREFPMYEGFTDGARKVMQLANQGADRLKHEYIGTEHILLALAQTEKGAAVKVFKSLG